MSMFYGFHQLKKKSKFSSKHGKWRQPDFCSIGVLRYMYAVTCTHVFPLAFAMNNAVYIKHQACHSPPGLSDPTDG